MGEHQIHLVANHLLNDQSTSISSHVSIYTRNSHASNNNSNNNNNKFYDTVWCIVQLLAPYDNNKCTHSEVQGEWGSGSLFFSLLLSSSIFFFLLKEEERARVRGSIRTCTRLLSHAKLCVSACVTVCLLVCFCVSVFVCVPILIIWWGSSITNQISHQSHNYNNSPTEFHIILIYPYQYH